MARWRVAIYRIPEGPEDPRFETVNAENEEEAWEKGDELTNQDDEVVGNVSPVEPGGSG